MISKELKRRSRRELVDIIYQMKMNEQKLQEEIAALQEGVRDKRIRISLAGSVSEAAASVTNLFAVAQTTANIYLDEIAARKEDAKQECARLIEEANATARDIVADAEKRRSELRSQYRVDYQKWQKLRAEIKKLENIKKQEP